MGKHNKKKQQSKTKSGGNKSPTSWVVPRIIVPPAQKIGFIQSIIEGFSLLVAPVWKHFFIEDKIMPLNNSAPAEATPPPPNEEPESGGNVMKQYPSATADVVTPQETAAPPEAESQGQPAPTQQQQTGQEQIGAFASSPKPSPDVTIAPPCESLLVAPLAKQAIVSETILAVPNFGPSVAVEIQRTPDVPFVVAEPVSSDALPPYFSLAEKAGRFFTCRVFQMEGSTSHSYQDAADADPTTGIVAIADGTTLGGHSEIVAEEAVRRFIEAQCDLGNELERTVWWDGTRKAWFRKRREEYNDATSDDQARWDKGGSATFLGVRFGDDGTYHLHTVGDCALLWFDADLNNCIAIDGATSFNSHPATLHTDADSVPEELMTTGLIEHQCPGTAALLATDALAKFLQEHKPWRTDPDFGNRLLSGSAEETRDWLFSHKEAYELDADDYTFVLLRFDVSPDAPKEPRPL